MSTFAYANPSSGPSAGGIGWFNFGNTTITPGTPLTGLTATLANGCKVTFDVEAKNISGYPRVFNAVQPPTWAGTNFGNGFYTGILGNVALYTSVIPLTAPVAVNTIELDVTNIVVLDPSGNPVPNYTVVVADAETTNLDENWVFTTDGGNWVNFATLGPNPPTLTGIGTQTATISGLSVQNIEANYLLTTQNAKNLTLTTTENLRTGQQAVAIGFAITQVSLYKDIGERINSNDQFVLSIGGTPDDQETTTGSATGIQSVFANVYGIPGNTYTIDEGMAPGSVSALTDYNILISAINKSQGQIPPVGPIPLNVTPNLGDVIEYTLYNLAPNTFTKSVDKAYANVGDVLTYTVVIDNPNNFTFNNVFLIDPAPTGTTYIGNLSVSTPNYTGDPTTGLTIASIGPDDQVTVSWQVKVSTTLPVQNPVINYATVTIPNGTSGITNAVTTQINTADLVSPGNFSKSVVPAFANIGDTITYTLTATNTGNVPANNVVITDSVPAGTSYVPGSITGNVAFTGDPTSTIKLTAPIPASGSVTINFKVLIGNSIPPVNPIPNNAEIKYNYTVDPAKPDAYSSSGVSNTVETTVSNASISLIKTVDKTIAYIGDTLTYNIAIKNTGNVDADKVVINDLIPNGTVYTPGSLTVSEAYSGGPLTSIILTNPIGPGKTVSISFKVTVTAIPNPNPIPNTATADYKYTVNPQNPDGVSASSTSNTVYTTVFRNNYRQQINDLIESIALQEAALAAIQQAEGAKIQKFAALKGVSPETLACVNKSVSDLNDAITTLESILKQKLNAVNCQINGKC